MSGECSSDHTNSVRTGPHALRLACLHGTRPIEKRKMSKEGRDRIKKPRAGGIGARLVQGMFRSDFGKARRAKSPTPMGASTPAGTTQSIRFDGIKNPRISDYSDAWVWVVRAFGLKETISNTVRPEAVRPRCRRADPKRSRRSAALRAWCRPMLFRGSVCGSDSMFPWRNRCRVFANERGRH